MRHHTRGGWGIRTPEGFHPTRFPSVRHRPLGESSLLNLTEFGPGPELEALWGKAGPHDFLPTLASSRAQ